VDRRCSFRRLGFVDWAATVAREASNRMLQQVLLDDTLTLGDPLLDTVLGSTAARGRR
jgi:hypothetical protein